MRHKFHIIICKLTFSHNWMNSIGFFPLHPNITYDSICIQPSKHNSVRVELPPPPQTNRIGFRNVSTCFYRIYAQILVYWLSLNWIKVVITTTIPFIFDYVLECSTLTFGYGTSGSTDVEMSFHQVTGIVQLYRLFGCIFAGNIHCGTLRFSIHVKFRFVVRNFFIVWTIF